MGAAIAAVILLATAGCASVPLEPIDDRAYDPERDNFAFSNDIIWAQPAMVAPGAGALPAPGRSDYYQHCVVVARSARQFFLHARFSPQSHPVSDEVYRALVRRVVSRDPRGDLIDPDPVVIPGYADLRTFSRDKETLLKEEMGSALQTYMQRGNWRMVLPFTRSHQARVADQLFQMLAARRPAVVHVVRFPRITINHAVLLYDAEQTPESVRFGMYDPNNPDVRRVLNYDRATRTFTYPPTDYFAGGPVDVYEIFRRGLF